jgi:hypothetical protein
MRVSWLFVLAALIGAGCAAFLLFPSRWSPAPGQGILAGMAMYFVAFTRVATMKRAERGQVPPLFGPRGIAPAVVFRAGAYLIILVGIAYVFFEQRAFYDVTWPLIILASWNLAEGMLRPRGATF